MSDDDPLKPLRDLLAQMPMVDVEASAFAEQAAAERQELDSWAAKTIEVARSLGRDDVVTKVEQVLASMDAADAKLAAATAHRKEQTAIAEETLNRLDE